MRQEVYQLHRHTLRPVCMSIFAAGKSCTCDEFKFLNIIYFTSFAQKVRGTYIRVLKGADVGVMWSKWCRKPENP